MSKKPHKRKWDADEREVSARPRHHARAVRPSVMVLVVLLVLLLTGATIGFGYLTWQQSHLDQVSQEVADTPLPATERPFDAPADEPMENPIDFAALQQENPDIYAWIYLPNTNVNLPVAQRAGDDFFYLDHDRSGEVAVEGTVFSQTANARDFSDPVTVLYGHNIVNDGMFATLHNYEDQAFFNENEEFYVYTLGHVLTYQVVAAYEYDDRQSLTRSTSLTKPYAQTTSPPSLPPMTRKRTCARV